MTRRFFIAAAAVCALFLAATGSATKAQDAPLSAQEIEHLLSGNTVEGKWDGAAYKSYFGPDGTTVFAPVSADKLTGKWRVNGETGELESFFAAVGWTGYSVLRTDAGFAWLRGGKTYPFIVIEGRDPVF